MRPWPIKTLSIFIEPFDNPSEWKSVLSVFLKHPIKIFSIVVVAKAPMHFTSQQKAISLAASIARVSAPAML
jgi:hypothetical protein